MTGGEPRWQSLYGEQATRLIDELEETDGGPLWTQDLYGERVRCLGAVHGFAGNMIAPLRGWEWLTPAQRERVSHTAERTLAGYCNGGRSAVGDPCMPAGSPLR